MIIKHQNGDDEIDYEYLREQLLCKTFNKLQWNLDQVILICKKWSNILSDSYFISQNFLQSKPSLLIQTSTGLKGSFTSKLLELDGGDRDHNHDGGLGFKITNFGGSATMKRIRSSCNGLILLDHTKGSGFSFIRSEVEYGLVVVNVLAKTHVTLPICPSNCTHLRCCLSLVFNPYLNQNKVIHICANHLGIETFVLGKSEWEVSSGPIVQNTPYDHKSWNDPISVSNGRFLHWDVGLDRSILSMETWSEEDDLIGVRETRLPSSNYVSFYRDSMSFFEMGGYLSLMHRVSFIVDYHIWVLKDFDNHGWEKKFDIVTSSITYLPILGLKKPCEYENMLPQFKMLKPICCLREGEVMVFEHTKTLCLYLLDLRAMQLKKLTDFKCKDHNILLHRPSLLHRENTSNVQRL